MKQIPENKFRVGERVKIISREFYEENKGKDGFILINGYNNFNPTMAEFCGRIATIREIFWCDACDAFHVKFLEEEFNKFIWSEDFIRKISEQLEFDFKS